MYLDEQEEKKFICGASIIKNNLLITAAQFYDKDANTLYKPNRIYILAGNIFRNYDDPSHNSKFIQKNQVYKCI